MNQSISVDLGFSYVYVLAPVLDTAYRPRY